MSRKVHKIVSRTDAYLTLANGRRVKVGTPGLTMVGDNACIIRPISRIPHDAGVPRRKKDKLPSGSPYDHIKSTGGPPRTNVSLPNRTAKADGTWQRHIPYPRFHKH